MGHISSPWVKYMPPTSGNSQSPSPPVPPSDPDTPLNLSKPKTESPLSHSTSTGPSWSETLYNNVEAKMLSQSLNMSRSFLPYPSLPHHSSSTFTVLNTGIILYTFIYVCFTLKFMGKRTLLEEYRGIM